MRDLAALFDFSGPAFFTVSKLLFFLQLILIIHVIKTGRPYWWIWILFCFPVLGGLAYSYLELLPDYRRGGGSFFSRFKTRRARIKERRIILEETDTVQNRIALAEELRLGGQLDEAEEVLKECFQGVFKDDPYTLQEMGRVYADKECWVETLDAVQRANKDQDRIMRMELDLLRARALVGLHKTEEAETILRQLSLSYIGEEARYRLAELLATTGRQKEGRALLEEITRKFRKGNASWRKTEREWFQKAKVELKKRRA